MARPRNPVPAYKKHPTRDEARCWANGRWIALGRWDSPESKDAYQRLCDDLRDNPASVRDPKHRLTVNEVLLAFVRFATVHYPPPSTSLKSFRDALGPVRELYGDTPAAEFGPLALQAVRQRMIDLKWSRGVINRHVSRVRRVFKWAAGQELVPPSVPAGLACVQGLQRGRTSARESEPVPPVPREHVAATLPFLNRHAAAMVELQLLTGMRPGEVCNLRLADLDRAGTVWVWRPDKHKTAHLGRDKTILFGPKAVAVIEKFACGGLKTPDPDSPLFSPAVAREERYAAMRAARKSRVPPSQVCRKLANPKQPARQGYEVTGYAGVVARAAKKAGVPHWHPNQLRHTFASEVRKAFGLEAAQVLLGHAKADVTQVYAERNLGLALRVIGEVG